VHHSIEQLDALWAALTGADEALRTRILAHYTNGQMPGALPHVARNDAQGQVLRIPTPDHPGWHAYERKPGGSWTEQR
jgi:hypothetical protein